MGFSLWTLCCSIGYAQCCRRKMGKKGWLSNTDKAFLVFPESETRFWSKSLFSLIRGWDFSMKKNKCTFFLPSQSVFSCPGRWIRNSWLPDPQAHISCFFPFPLAVDVAWRATERTAWWCLCWVSGGCPRPDQTFWSTTTDHSTGYSQCH